MSLQKIHCGAAAAPILVKGWPWFSSGRRVQSTTLCSDELLLLLLRKKGGWAELLQFILIFYRQHNTPTDRVAAAATAFAGGIFLQWAIFHSIWIFCLVCCQVFFSIVCCCHLTYWPSSDCFQFFNWIFSLLQKMHSEYSSILNCEAAKKSFIERFGIQIKRCCKNKISAFFNGNGGSMQFVGNVCVLMHDSETCDKWNKARGHWKFSAKRSPLHVYEPNTLTLFRCLSDNVVASQLCANTTNMADRKFQTFYELSKFVLLPRPGQ